MTPEQRFQQWLRGCFPPEVDWQRIETSTTPGVPDINLCYRGREIWIETKVRKDWDEVILLRKEQFAWGMRRAQCYGKVYVVVQTLLDEPYVNIWRYPFVCKPYSCGSKYVYIAQDPPFGNKIRHNIFEYLFPPVTI